MAAHCSIQVPGCLGPSPSCFRDTQRPCQQYQSSHCRRSDGSHGQHKVQAGAYQQGAQLLNKALTDSAGSVWATRNQALADLALAQLIIGDTEPGWKPCMPYKPVHSIRRSNHVAAIVRERTAFARA